MDLHQKILDTTFGDTHEHERIAIYRRLALVVIYLGWMAAAVGLVSLEIGWKEGQLALYFAAAWMWLIAWVRMMETRTLSNGLVDKSCQNVRPKDAPKMLRQYKWKSLAFAVGLSVVLVGLGFPRDTPWFFYVIFAAILSAVIWWAYYRETKKFMFKR